MRTGSEIRIIRKKAVFGNGDTRKRRDKVGNNRKGETPFIPWCSLN